MARTPEQKAADEALTAAIEAVAEAYDMNDPGFIMTEFMVLRHSRGWIDGDDESPATALDVIYQDGYMPYAMSFGLVEIARNKLRSDSSRDADE